MFLKHMHLPVVVGMVEVYAVDGEANKNIGWIKLVLQILL